MLFKILYSYPLLFITSLCCLDLNIFLFQYYFYWQCERIPPAVCYLGYLKACNIGGPNIAITGKENLQDWARVTEILLDTKCVILNHESAVTDWDATALYLSTYEVCKANGLFLF